MSTRCSIVFSGPIHIYAESNNDYSICISHVDGPRDSYNRDVCMSHDDLEKIYKELQEYFENGASYRPKETK